MMSFFSRIIPILKHRLFSVFGAQNSMMGNCWDITLYIRRNDEHALYLTHNTANNLYIKHESEF